MKYIVIVPDGMFDHPVEDLDKRTPLQVARTPHMDYLAQHGMTGMVQTIPDKLPPGSDVGNMAILGYDPCTSLTGRSPLEAANMGITLKDNEVSFRCNLVTERDGIMIDYSAGHIRTDEAALLIQALNEEIEDEDIVFYPGKSYRHIMVLRTDTPQEYMALKTVPPHDISDKNITGYLPQGELDSRIRDLIAKSREIFAGHSVNQVRIDLQENPATMIWLWGQGTKPNLEPFAQKYGLKGSIISAVDLVNGIGRLAGLDIIDVPGATGYFDTNYAGKAEYALNSLEDHDYVYVHIESPDEAGHVGSYKEKIRAIENIDKHIVGPIRDYVDAHPDSRMLVLPDHPTPVALRTHTHEPVGFAMYGKGIEHNGAELYNEENTRALGIKFKSGEEMISWFVRENLCF